MYHPSAHVHMYRVFSLIDEPHYIVFALERFRTILSSMPKQYWTKY